MPPVLKVTNIKNQTLDCVRESLGIGCQLSTLTAAWTVPLRLVLVTQTNLYEITLMSYLPDPVKDVITFFIFRLGGCSMGPRVYREKTIGWNRRGGTCSQWTQVLQSSVPVFTGPRCWPSKARQRWSFTGKTDLTQRQIIQIHIEGIFEFYTNFTQTLLYFLLPIFQILLLQSRRLVSYFTGCPSVFPKCTKKK